MKKINPKGFFGNHAKSSALIVSLALHTILIIGAVSFVAVKIIIRDETSFEAKPVNRPKMPPKKLQVPVKVKPRKTPKIRKQIVVKQRVNRKMPEIKMPEVKGIKGGLGNAGSGAVGGIGGVGFSMPEINVFGVKSKGEKIYILLDASAEMMYDEMGGVEAYELIKKELIRIVGALPSTVLFNVIVFQNGQNYKALFPSMALASKSNVEAMQKWIEPLNAATKGMKANDYGIKTLGPGGCRIEKIEVESIKSYVYWVNPALMAMRQQADSVYLLSCGWGPLYHNLEHTAGSSAEIRQWNAYFKRAKEKYEKENEIRKKNGKPPRILRSESLVRTYFPGVPYPGHDVNFSYTPRYMRNAMNTVRKEYYSKTPSKSGLSKSNPSKYSFNVIQFVRKSTPEANENLKKLSHLCRGAYRKLSGLKAVQSSISAGSAEDLEE